MPAKLSRPSPARQEAGEIPVASYGGRVPDAADSFDAFRHLSAPNAVEYRRVLQAFSAAREAGWLLLRPAEVAEQAGPREASLSEDATVALLTQLSAWGNLERSADRARARSIEEFQRVGYLYSLSAQGLACEQALDHFRERLGEEGALDTRPLRDLRANVTALATEIASADPASEAFDVDRGRKGFDNLMADFRRLAGEAKTFLLRLKSSLELQRLDLQDFLSYKQWLIGYLTDFLAELSETTPHVIETLDAIEPARLAALLDRLAADDAANAPRPGEDTLAKARAARQRKWTTLDVWFRGEPASGTPSRGEEMRRWAQSAIPQLLQAVQGIHDRRGRRADRAADLATLARWFLDAPNEDAAAAMWAGLTGLSPARHLHLDPESRAARERADPVAPSTPWARAEPLRLPIRLRRTGKLDRPGRKPNITDGRAERARLRELAEAERTQAEAAQREIATDGPQPLSRYAALSPAAFAELFDLLGRAFAERASARGPIDAFSTDGTLRIRLEKPVDGAVARLRTRGGVLTGEDFQVTIEPTLVLEPAGAGA